MSDTQDSVNRAETRAIALVTGGASGIGEATCAALADAGATVIVADRSYERALAVAEALPHQSEAVELDVTDAGACQRVIDDLVQSYGHIDYLAHVSGAAGRPDSSGEPPMRSLLELSRDEWDWVLDITLSGAFNVVVPTARSMVACGSGSFVVVTAAGSVRVVPGRDAYCTAKAGLAMLVKHLATEVAASGVRIHSVAPGVIETPMTTIGLAQGAFTSPPIGRVGQASEVADTIAYLLSPKASYITAKTIYVDGGLLTG